MAKDGRGAPVLVVYSSWTGARRVLFASDGYDGYDDYPSWAAGLDDQSARVTFSSLFRPASSGAGECRQHSPASFRVHSGARMAQDGGGAPVLMTYPLPTEARLLNI